MSSLLVVKNLPRNVTDEAFCELFGKFGEITYSKLKYTVNGVFRHFGYVGYKNQAAAEAALSQLNATFFHRNQLKIEYFDPKKEAEPPKFSQAKNRPSRDKQTQDVEEAAFSAVLRHLPAKVTHDQIVNFFHGCNVKKCDLSHPSRVIVQFDDEKNLSMALRRNKNVIGGKKVFVSKYENNSRLIAAGSAKKTVVNNARTAHEPLSETISDTGRLFLRNLSKHATEEDVDLLCSPFGLLTEVNVPIDKISKFNKGFALVTFMLPENALQAFNELNGSVFQGRRLAILAGQSKPEATLSELPFKLQNELSKKNASKDKNTWNTLFLGANAVADSLAKKFDKRKDEIFDDKSKSGSLAVRMALGETEIVLQTRRFLIDHGINLECFESDEAKRMRSRTCFIMKNVAPETTFDELMLLCHKFGAISRLVLPPRGVTALVEFEEPQSARAAFKSLAYSKFKHLPLLLEWAPLNAFNSDAPKVKSSQIEAATDVSEKLRKSNTLFVKNLNFSTTKEKLLEHFAKCAGVKDAVLAVEKKGSELKSCGYGFVEFKKSNQPKDAIKTMQSSLLDGHALELSISRRGTAEDAVGKKPVAIAPRKSIDSKIAPSTKIIVRNVPFQAESKDIKELFSVFGEIKCVRLPRKIASSQHRGFAFVDMTTKEEAKKAFEALSLSTHLYGRRMVLEWAHTDEKEELENLRKRAVNDVVATEQIARKKPANKANLIKTISESK